jgi:hypothetical protein
MPIIQRPYVPPEDQVPQEDNYVNPGDTRANGSSGEPITLLKAIALLTSKHVREYEEAVGPIQLPEQVYAAWEIEPEKAGNQ